MQPSSAPIIPPTSCRRRRAFTLIEVTIVILIVMILTTLSIGVYGPFRQRQAASSGLDKLITAMHKARTNAIYEGLHFRVTFVEQDRTFWVDRVGDAPADWVAFSVVGQTSLDPITNTPFAVGQPKVVRPEALPEGVLVHSVRDVPNDNTSDPGKTYHYFIFKPDGSSTHSGIIELVPRGVDATVPQNLYGLRVWGPSGAVQRFAQENVP